MLAILSPHVRKVDQVRRHLFLSKARAGSLKGAGARGLPINYA